ncbi:MAG: restriction endonuclease subunit S [Oscillospiraceae bacterium]|nr:restriction endonuclease subunit S [Oscillospiraceae bacterium]
MREMKDSGIEWIGEIPKNKKILRNKYMFSYEKGKLPSSTNFDKKGFAYIGASDLDSCKNEYTTYTEDETLPNAEYNDLLVLWDGARAGLCGTHKIGKISSTIVRIKCDETVYQPFLYWYYKGFENFMYQSVNGTTIPHMNRKYIENIGFIDWTIEEQQKISTYLDIKCTKIDSIIEKQEKVIEKLKEYKLSVITEAVTKGLNPDVKMKDSGVEFLGEVPENWEVIKFGRCITIKSNLVPPENYYDYPQIAPDSIEKNSARLLDYKTVMESGVISWNHLFFKGQIIYSKIRPLLNKVIIAPFDGLCSADMYPIETENNSKFIVYVILSKYFSAQVGLLTENRVKMPKINQNELSGIIVAIPKLEEQHQIANYLDKKCSAIDKSIEQKQAIIEKLKEYKKSLIYEVVTGKREV